MFSFSTVEIDVYVGLEQGTLDAMLAIEDSIAHSISASVQAFRDTSVDSDKVHATEGRLLEQEQLMDDVLFSTALKGAMKRQDFDALQALVSGQKNAPGKIATLNADLVALHSARYDAFREAWSVSRTRGKSGPRDSIEGKVVTVDDVHGETRIMKIVAHNIWRCYVRIQLQDGYLDNDLPQANSAEFNELSVKYASTAKRFLCAFGHVSETSRTDKITKKTTAYKCDGSVQDLHRAMDDKSYGKLAFGGSVGVETIGNASKWLPSNG